MYVYSTLCFSAIAVLLISIHSCACVNCIFCKTCGNTAMWLVETLVVSSMDVSVVVFQDEFVVKLLIQMFWSGPSILQCNVINNQLQSLTQKQDGWSLLKGHNGSVQHQSGVGIWTTDQVSQVKKSCVLFPR